MGIARWTEKLCGLVDRVRQGSRGSAPERGGFNALELAVLDWYKTTYGNPQLTAQIESAKLQERKWTGVGFFVSLEVPQLLDPVDLEGLGGAWGPGWPVDGPQITSDGIHGSGFAVLWGEAGYINCIEMCAYGDHFRETVKKFELSSPRSDDSKSASG